MRNIPSPIIVDDTPSITKIADISPNNDEDDPSLKADDFFSSLELQSSAKKTGISPNSSGKSASGVLTRSKTTAVIQSHALSREIPQNVKNERELPQNVKNEKDIPQSVKNEREIPQSIKNDNILMSSFTTDQFDSSASSCLMKPEAHDHLMMKDDERSDQEESACEEESNEEYEDDDEEDDDDDCPPRSHTGGKWKPGGLMTRGSPPSWTRTSSSSTHGDEYRGGSSGDWGLLLDDCPGSSVATEQGAPPPHFTGGKWKPTPPNQSAINTSQVLKTVEYIVLLIKKTICYILYQYKILQS